MGNSFKVSRTFISATIAILFAMGCGRKVTITGPVGPIILQDELLYREGIAAFNQGTPEGYTQAADAFRKASALRPQRCEYSLSLAQALLFLAQEEMLNWEEFESRQSEAAAVMDSAGAACASYESFVLRVRALITGRGPAAAGMINRSVDLDPNDPMNWVVLGNMDPTSRHLLNGQGGGKWVAMVRAAELQPDSALIQYELGKNYQSLRGKESEARQAFERAMQLSPRHFRSYLGLAYSADETVDVEPIYQKVVELAPGFLEGRIALGSNYAGLDEIEKAAEQYTVAVIANPKYDIAHFRLGLLMLQAERPEEAEKYFNLVVQLSPASYEAHYYLGNISYNRNDLDRAKTQYEEALRIRVNYADAEYGLGHVFHQQNKTDLALAEFEKIIKIAPRYADAYFSRGDIRAERRQFVEALSDYQNAITLYEQLIKSIDATIAFAEAHGQSRLMQAENKRNERDKARIEALLQRARHYVPELEEGIRNNP